MKGRSHLFRAIEPIVNSATEMTLPETMTGRSHAWPAAYRTGSRGMTGSAWPGLLLGAGLLAALPATAHAQDHASDCAGVVPIPAPPPGLEGPTVCAAAPLPGASPPARVVAVVRQPDRVSVAVVPASGGVPLAGPAEVEALAVDALRSPTLAVVPDRWLGGRGIAVVVGNAYASTGRSMATRSLHLFVRTGDQLRPVFATYLEAEHSGAVGCPGRPNAVCRRGWTRRYVLSAVPAPSGTGLPVLTVRDARSGRVLSTHRPGAGGYAPPSFEQLPPFVEP